MSEYTEMLNDFIRANNLNVEIIRFKKEVRSCRAAADLLKVPLNEIIKSVLFINENKESILAIALGDDKIDFTKLAKVTGSNVRLAEPQEVLEITGYPAGGVPPIGIYGVKVIVDKKVLAKETVIGGGGDEFSLLKIKTTDIVDSNEDCQIDSVVK